MVLPSLTKGGKPGAAKGAVGFLEEVDEVREISGILKNDFNMEVSHREKNWLRLFRSTVGGNVLKVRRRAILVCVESTSFEDADSGVILRGPED